MTARFRADEIGYIYQLQFGSGFNYTLEFHSKADVEDEIYFHNTLTRYLATSDAIRVNNKHEDGSCEKGRYEVISITDTLMIIDYGDLQRKIRAANNKD